MLIVTSAAIARICLFIFTTKISLSNVGWHILSLMNPSHDANPGNEKVCILRYDNIWYFEYRSQFRPDYLIVCARATGCLSIIRLLFVMPADDSVRWGCAVSRADTGSSLPCTQASPLAHLYQLLLALPSSLLAIFEQLEAGTDTSTAQTRTDPQNVFVFGSFSPFVLQCEKTFSLRNPVGN